MKTKTVQPDELDPNRGLRAEDYVSDVEDIPPEAWKGLEQIARACYRTAERKGWWEGYPNKPVNEQNPERLASKLCLIHSEVSEALEELRENDGGTYFTEPYNDYGAGMRRICKPGAKGAKPEGFPAELADVVIRVFDLALFLGIDLSEVIKLKMLYNETRPHRHGGKAL